MSSMPTFRGVCFWFGLITWVMPCVLALLFLFLVLLLENGLGVAVDLDRLTPGTGLSRGGAATLVNVLGAVSCVGCLAMIAWCWMVARSFARRASESPDGRLGKGARLFALAFSLLALAAGAQL